MTELQVTTPDGDPTWSGRSVAAQVGADRPAAIGRLPGERGTDPFLRLAAAFLAEYAGHTRRAYTADLRAWQQHCADIGVHPFDARRHHVAAWAGEMTARAGAAPASIALRLSALSKFSGYGIAVEVLDYSPVAHVRRPKVSDQSSTVGLSADELARVLMVAKADSPRSHALVTLLAFNGLRIAEALAVDVVDYSWHRSQRVLRLTRKGGRRSLEHLAEPTVAAIEAYLACGHPSSGPLFLSRTGRRLPYQTAFDHIQRLAIASGVPAGPAITPHSLRHTFITEALAAGAALQDVQDAAGHRDPRTTRRYDHTRLRPDRHPAFLLAAHIRLQS